MPKGNYTTPEIFHDAPLETGEKFDFNFDDYAATIARLIASKKTKTPIALCVSGAWGSGKTTLLRRIKIMLDDTTKLKSKKKRSEVEFLNTKENPADTFRQCRTVWFNAWKYSDEDELLVALIRIVLQEMSQDTIVSKVFGKLLDPTYPRRDVVSTVLSWFKIKLPSVDVELNTGEPVPTQLAEKTAILDLFDDALDRLMAAWIHRRLDAKKINPNNGILVVFIDDLDRCLPAKMVQVLEAVKLFLDKKGCIFVLGADTGIVQQAILKHYSDAGVTGESAKDYLDKIVQLRFELPPIIESSMQDYLTREGVITTGWKDSWKSLVTGANVNPRSVKAFMNDINLQWSMLINLGQTDGVNRTDFNAWQLLMRTAPLNFVRHIRVRLFDSEQKYNYVLDAIKWAKGADELNDKFIDYQDDFRLRRVLQEINFSKGFNPTVLNAFLHLMAPPSSSILEGKEKFERRSIGEQKLRVFLSHASTDKQPIRELYKKLMDEGFEVWLDSENLIAGQSWQVEIPKALRNSDVVIICLSKNSVNREGYVQKEIRMALDTSMELPEGDIFVIPARLEECPVPEALAKYHWVDLFDESGFEKLLRALETRAQSLELRRKPRKK
jgi:hypothetical protein